MNKDKDVQEDRNDGGFRRFFMTYVYPLIVVCASLLPWYLFARYILKVDFAEFIGHSGSHLIVAKALIAVFLISFIAIWIVYDKKKHEPYSRFVEKFFMVYGKLSAILVSVVFGLIIMAVLMML